MWLYEVYRRWRRKVTVLTLEPGKDDAERSAALEFDSADHGALRISRSLHPIRSLSVASPAFWRACVHQLAAIKRAGVGGHRIRLHVLRAFPEGIVGWFSKRLAPRRVTLVTYAHGEEILVARTSRQLEWFTRRIYRDSDVVIANSRNTSRMVRELAPEACVEVIHPGVDAEAYELPADEVHAARARWGWRPETLVLVTVARMEARKSQATVIRAVAELVAEGVKIAYVCAGSGPEERRLHALATELGIADRVRFTGLVSDREKRLIFAAADVHAMPAVRAGEMIEGFGIVFIEAAAAGIPSICGNSGGQLEAVQDGITGIAVDGNDQAAVTNAIRRLALDPAMRQELGRNGRAFAARHDWARVVASTWLILERNATVGLKT